ncbi:hypothetical protein Pint_22038 [Pistacia integerrima]|uniref:Uncharacterized protein n=1 Tax=Pistacia integerrima TaxID=434235 RepID=A0ACC0YH17_9ROSI|nr:hypothetical protein Pint_22038 [Pistacia integerrima]
MHRAKVMVKGSALRRDAALRAICRSGILLSYILYETFQKNRGMKQRTKRFL